MKDPATTRPPKLNAATHWMTSRQPLIPGESREDLLAHLEHWNALYPGVESDELLSDLVRDAAFEQWLLFRSQRQYDASLAILHKTQIDHWTPEQNNTFQLRERYLNSVQRRFNRYRSGILQYQTNLRAQAREDRAAKACAETQEKKKPKQPEPRPAPPAKTDIDCIQTVNVYQENGQTKTYVTPGNEQLLGLAESRYETTLVWRCILFEDHYVPPEYAAFTERAAKLKNLPFDGRINLPITFRSFPIALEREKELGGHIREWPDLRAADLPAIQLKRQQDR